jgi:plastocyanin
MRSFVPVTLLVAAATALAAGCGGSSDSSSGSDTTVGSDTTATTSAASGTLSGSVGPGFDISMGASEAAAGEYTLTVDDQSAMHNFHLTGPGVDVKTDVTETGVKTFTITLQKGEYHFQCDPHSSSMNGTLTVN